MPDKSVFLVAAVIQLGWAFDLYRCRLMPAEILVAVFFQLAGDIGDNY